MGNRSTRRMLLALAVAISVATPIAAWQQPGVKTQDPHMLDELAAPQPSVEIKQLLEAARQFSEAGQYQQALQAAQQALDSAQQSGDIVGISMAQLARGDALVGLKLPLEAVAAYQAAAEAWMQVGDGPGQIASLARAGLQLLDADPRRGRELLAQAVALGRKETQRPLAAAQELNDAGDQLYYLDDYAEARKFFGLALAIREQLAPDSLLVAQSLFDLAWTLTWVESVGRADEYFRRSLEIRQRLAPGSPELAHTLMGIGGVAMDRADYQASRDYDLQALGILEALGPGFEFRKATALHNLGMALFRLGDLKTAEDYLRRAVEIQAGVKSNPEYALDRHAVYLSRLGNVVMQGGGLDEAEELYRRALSLAQAFGRSGLSTAGQTLIYLGRLKHLRGELSAAKNYLEQSIRIFENRQGSEDDLADALQSLAQVAMEQGNLGSAEDAYRRAFALREGIQGQAHPQVASAGLGLATVWAKKGGTAQALDLALRAEHAGRAHGQLTAQSLSEREALLYSATRPSGLDVLLSLAASGAVRQVESAPRRGQPEEVKQ